QDYTLFNPAGNGSIANCVYYRANLSPFGGDLTDINWPEVAAGFGVVRLVLSGTYGYLEVQQLNGNLWRATTSNAASSFSSWYRISNVPEV
ncbi:hypothetical protein, partial [Sulfitobacter sp. HGT1]|uniref:hypothetical protein n=1 Tax=Sulfitobacter sp. HGT1 TaxID=2735435 RepID=UPI001C3DC728